MHDDIGNHATNHDACAAHHHDKHALAHHLDDGRHVDLDQHQYDEYRQNVLTQPGIDYRLVGNDMVTADGQVAQENRRGVDK